MTLKTLALALLGASLLAVSPVTAHGPTPQKGEEKIAIAAPPAKVWEIVKDFGKFADWNPAITKSAGEGGNASGATRVITLKTGGDLSESVDDYNEKDMMVAYRLAQENVEKFPVSFYSATITVKAAGDGSEVEWTARFYRADTGNEPPEDRNDAAAVKAMQEFMQTGLQGLKAKAEAKS